MNGNDLMKLLLHYGVPSSVMIQKYNQAGHPNITDQFGRAKYNIRSGPRSTRVRIETPDLGTLVMLLMPDKAGDLQAKEINYLSDGSRYRIYPPPK